MIPSSLLRHLAFAALLFLSSLASGLGVTLLPQEQAIANYMIDNPNQGRPTLILDPIIEGVARARAKDMAVRNYFSHVNPDGVAANYLLRQAGYQLPSWWGTDPTANYVESIAAGYASPSDTWNAWMNSPPHKVHLLGQNSFYATETHYGVGYYYDPNSTYQYYWVVITAPPQPLEIMTPDSSAVVTTSTVNVAGTADPGTSPASVQFCVENSNGASAYQAAKGIANWSGTAIGLVPGTNVIHVQSLDGSGNVIAHATRSVTYLVDGTLMVSVSGSGSVTSTLTGTTSQAVGEPVKIKASPAAGYIFAGWTGSIVSRSAVLSFTMQNGLDLQANFVPNPFPAVSGGYYGMLTSGSGAQNGLVRLNVTSTGLFTGRVQLPGIGWSISGQLDANGDATVTIPRTGQTPLVVTVQVEFTGDSGQVTGTVTDGADSFGFAVIESTYNATTNAAPQAGRYTLVLTANPSVTGTSAPQGSGYATIVVGANGTATIASGLADGTPYSATGHVANDGVLAFYCVPSGAPAGSSLYGSLTFQSTVDSDVAGTLAWTRGASAGAPYYPAGFSEQLPSVGSAYLPPGAGLQAMDVAPGAATAAFADGNLAQPLDVPVVVSQSETATMAAPGSPDLTLSINPASGVISGSFVLPNGNLTRAVRGVILQKQQAAFGFFRGVNLCGSFSLTPGS